MIDSISKITQNILPVESSNIDPYSIYEDFFEVGHGNFGSVYSASVKCSGEIVAIKKIELDEKRSKDNFIEIQRELSIMRSIDHPNCIILKEIYMSQSLVWIVMEYCIGSAYDLINISSKLTEMQISYLVFYTLTALHYIHSIGLIHRDLKAANILITAEGIVKLADFGSSSLKTPANTFVGSPYWMAPEVILAMDDGEYDDKADIWSLGITCYELCEKNPPHYHLNIMSALYHISQSDAPQLLDDKWSNDCKNFINSILKKDPNDRPSIEELFKYNFLNKEQPTTILKGLILECAQKARKSDSIVYNKFVKTLNENNNSPSSNSTDDGKSNITSEDMCIVADRLSEIGIDKSNFINVERKVVEKKLRTIKTMSTINEELYKHQDNTYLQLKDYQALRKSNLKQLKILEQKLNYDMLDHQKIHQKFVETTKCNNDKAVRVLLEKQENELDKIHKQRKSVLKKITKSYGVINYEKKNLFHTFRSIQHKARRHAKNLSFLGAGDLKPLYNEPSLLTISSSNDNKNNSLNAIDKVNIKHQTTVTEINTKFINEKYQLLISQCESLGKIELEEVSYLARTEVNKIEQIYRMKKIHLQKLHDLETESQNDYMKRKIHEMEKKHLFDQKNIPKELKLKEMQISKLYKDCIKSIQQHYKALSKMTLEKTPKENHQNVRDKLKEEKMQKIIDIKYNMDQHITSLVNFDQLKLCDIQSNQKFELQQQLNYELKSLKQYQNSQIHQLNIAKGKDLENIAKKYDQITDDSNNKLLSDLSSLHINHSDALSRYSFNNQFTHSLIDTKSTTNSNLNLPFQISSLHITPNLDSQSLSDSIDNKSSSQNSSKM